MEELADLLNGENRLIEALPKMAEASQSSALKGILEDHLKVTKNHAHRLQDIFSNIAQSPQRVTCESIKKLIKESEDVINKYENDAACDAAIISVVQRMEQYEITGYQTACEHAVNLGHTWIVEVLNKTLDEERVMNFYLNELAQYMINVQSMDPTPESKGRGFYIPEGNFGRGGIKKKSKNPDASRFTNEENTKEDTS
jgi:ferritin-like metal-binding protein YciE